MKLNNGIIKNFCSSKNNKILYKYDNNFVKVSLNDVKNLNSLDLEMIESMTKESNKWNNNNIIFIDSLSPKAFCAGGNIKDIYLYKKNNENLDKLVYFFKKEYVLDEKLSNLNTIPLINGICMGGGVGISIHSKNKISTNKAKFAMPECKIGLFTDVSGGYFLSRLKGNYGKFLALTGYILRGKELKEIGVSDYFIPEWKNEYEEEIKNLSSDLNKVKLYLNSISEKVNNEFSLQEQVETYFKFDTLEEIYNELNNNDKYSEFAKQCLNLMKNSSYLSQKICLEQIKRGKDLNLKDNYEMDYILCQNIMLGNEFFEGVRCLLIDKGDKPKWEFNDYKQISKEKIDNYFIKRIDDKIFN